MSMEANTVRMLAAKIGVVMLLISVVAGTANLAAGRSVIAHSDNFPTATDNIAVRDGVFPGEVIVSWDHVPEATHYRIGYVNMDQDYDRAKDSPAGDWKTAFVYVDEDARNLPVSGAKVEYTLRRLGQDDQHAFTVLAGGNIVNTVQMLSGDYTWPSNPRWRFFTVVDRGGATTPTAIDYTNQYPNCDAVRAHHPGGVKRGSPIYRPALDRDGDGHACEPSSTGQTGNYLPIEDIGTFTGVGDNADTVVSLDTGLYRITSNHLGETGNFIVWLTGVSSGDRELVANEIGNANAVTTMQVGDDFPQNAPDNYLLSVQAEGSWEITIERIESH